MKYFAISLIYVAFCALIGFAIWSTGTAWPLFALILTPSVTWKEGDKDVLDTD